MRALRATLPVLLIVLLPMGMLYTLWLNPTSAGEDDVMYYYPLHKMVGQQLRQGQWPDVNPYEATGMPLMGDPQSAVMYPPSWLFAVLAPKLAYSLTLFLGFSLAGAGAYLYLRRLGLVRAAACFGAVAFMFCGFLVGHRVHWSILHAAAWLPWGLWCIELVRVGGAPVRASEGNALRRHYKPAAAFAALVPVVYLALTAGHWPTFIHMGVIWLAYLLLRARPLGRALVVAGLGLAVALALAAPQIDATMQLMAAATRNRMGYATAGENSFHPASAVLALFPMLLGSRTPNLFPTPWWGPWHLCETLGYVGLVTLVLAGAAVWKLYRRPRAGETVPPSGAAGGFAERPDGGASSDLEPSPALPSDSFRPLVRTWVWIALGAMVWMLGYYLPTYWLIYKLPVLGYVRCPARMILAVDMALATLAAVAVHVVAAGREKGTGSESKCFSSIRCLSPSQGPADGDGEGDRHRIDEKHFDSEPVPLSVAIRRGVIRVLPAAMVGMLLLYAAMGGLATFFAGGQIPGWDGAPGWQMITSVLPTNPAVWVQFVLAAATAGVVLAWLAAPARRAPLLVVLLAADLLLVTRFVDVPAGVTTGPDPDKSPAAEWLKANAQPGNGPYLVWGIGQTYNDRPAELLRPKTAHALGVGTINTYGPFQSPAHAHLFGFQIFGTNRDWANLIRRNALLSEYGVRFIVTARRDVRDVIESVRIPAAPPPADGPNVLGGDWKTERVQRDPNGVLTLRTPIRWWWSMATQPVTPTPGAICRISLDARGPQDGAADYLRAEFYDESANRSWQEQDSLGLTVPAEQIGTDWRHFEWTFQVPGVRARGKGAGPLFRLFTPSERPIEVRNVSLCTSRWPEPLYPWKLPPNDGKPMERLPDDPLCGWTRLSSGQQVYRLAAELPATDPGNPPVAIYENRLPKPGLPWPGGVHESLVWGEDANAAEIEKLRWDDGDARKHWWHASAGIWAPPRVGIRIPVELRQTSLLIAVGGPAAGLCVLVAGILLLLSRRRAG